MNSGISMAPAAQGDLLPALETSTEHTASGPRWMFVILQLLLTILIVRQFEIEQRRQLFTMLLIAMAGFPIYFALPSHWRSWFFVGLTGLTSGFILGWPQTAIALGIGGLLIATCYLPLRVNLRICLLLVAGTLLAFFRSGSAGLFWPFVGSMFMFRLILFVNDTRHLTRMPPLNETLPYFFLIPNVCFVLFPVVDFSTYQQTRHAKLSADDCQHAANWIVLGITHLLIYRIIRYWLLPPPGSIENVNTLLLFLVTNYGLYLRVAGQFHLAIGVLHLYGFRLPPTHDWFFFASSLTDIWRRINIYWKDFMSKMFFMPAFFRLRRWCGDPLAVPLAVLWVFCGTWLAHSWQVFWLLGEFPLSKLDAQLWLAAGLVVSINALLDYRQVRRRKTDSAVYSLPAAIGRVLRTMATFLLVSLFWARWTNPDLLITLRRDVGLDYFLNARQLAICGALLLAVFVAGLALHYALFQLARRPRTTIQLHSRHRSSLNIAWLASLLLLTQPVLTQNVPMEWTHVLLAMQSDHFSQTEASQLVQGYYEQLNEGSIQAGLFSGHGAAHSDEGRRQHFMDITRRRRDALQLELIPNFKTVYNGATLSTNRWGMRNRDIEQDKPPGVVRIAAVGSSVVMGYGVSDDETFAAHLERYLNDKQQGDQQDDQQDDQQSANSVAQYEVLNFGVGKYTAIHRRLLIQSKVLDFHPDVVLYFAHQDEITGPVFDMAKLADLGLIKDPCLLKILERAGVDDATPGGVIRNRMQDHALDILRCSYERIVADCRAHNVTPVWVDLPIPGQFVIPGTPEMARRAAMEAGFVIIDLTDWADGYEAEQLKLTADVHHANSLGHQRIADRLLQELRSHPALLQPH